MAQLPVSKVFLFDVNWVDDTPQFSAPSFASDFNPMGYNNQVFFWDNFNFFLASDASKPGTTDIFHADLKNKSLRNITRSDTPEYSPFWSDADQRLYVVRVEDTQAAVQRIVALDTSGLAPDEYILPVSNAGYFLLRPDNRVVVFLVDEINRLELMSRTAQTYSDLITLNPGRCFKVGYDDVLYYVHKISDEQWFLKTYNWKYVGRVLVQMPYKVEDFELDRKGIVYCASGSRLLRYDPAKPGGWVTLTDFSSVGLKNIKRLSWSPDYKRLALIYHDE